MDAKRNRKVATDDHAEDLVRLIIERDFGQRLNKSAIREIAKKVRKAIPAIEAKVKVHA
jgi:hypothetical protein